MIWTKWFIFVCSCLDSFGVVWGWWCSCGGLIVVQAGVFIWCEVVVLSCDLLFPVCFSELFSCWLRCYLIYCRLSPLGCVLDVCFGSWFLRFLPLGFVGVDFRSLSWAFSLEFLGFVSLNLFWWAPLRFH